MRNARLNRKAQGIFTVGSFGREETAEPWSGLAGCADPSPEAKTFPKPKASSLSSGYMA